MEKTTIRVKMAATETELELAMHETLAASRAALATSRLETAREIKRLVALSAPVVL